MINRILNQGRFFKPSLDLTKKILEEQALIREQDEMRATGWNKEERAEAETSFLGRLAERLPLSRRVDPIEGTVIHAQRHFGERLYHLVSWFLVERPPLSKRAEPIEGTVIHAQRHFAEQLYHLLAIMSRPSRQSGGMQELPNWDPLFIGVTSWLQLRKGDNDQPEISPLAERFVQEFRQWMEEQKEEKQTDSIYSATWGEIHLTGEGHLVLFSFQCDGEGVRFKASKVGRGGSQAMGATQHS